MPFAPPSSKASACVKPRPRAPPDMMTTLSATLSSAILGLRLAFKLVPGAGGRAAPDDDKKNRPCAKPAGTSRITGAAAMIFGCDVDKEESSRVDSGRRARARAGAVVADEGLQQVRSGTINWRPVVRNMMESQGLQNGSKARESKALS